MGSMASDVFTSIDVRDAPRPGGCLSARFYQLGSSRRFYRLDFSGGALPAAQHHVQGAHGGRTGGGGTQHLIAE